MDGASATRCAALLAGVVSVTVHATALHLLAPGAAGPRAASIGTTTLQIVTRVVTPVPAPAPATSTAPARAALPRPPASSPPPPPTPTRAVPRSVAPTPAVPRSDIASIEPQHARERPGPTPPPETASPPDAAAPIGSLDTSVDTNSQAADRAVPSTRPPLPARPVGGGVNPPPEYPARAVSRGWEGEVLLRVEVLASGRAGEVSTVTSSGHQILDHAACEAVSSWRFEPALRDGRPVRSTLLQPIRFRLER